MSKFQVVTGGRDKLEQEILYEIFRPTASNHDYLMALIHRLKYRAQLSVVVAPKKSPGAPLALPQSGVEQA